ncbi:hypothetical protein ACFVUS_40820 [Nocardia sp. NPDC058058]|uniref:hypothetical protein n=1 Tax=Nocardia sp. NPDC058058 TaxID=3346317 RepID=UPI0036DEBA81
MRNGTDLTKRFTSAPTTRCGIGKRRYMTRSDAELVLACLDRTNPHRREKRVYCCPVCDGWHLTSWSLTEYEASRVTVNASEATTDIQVGAAVQVRRPVVLEPISAEDARVPTPLEVALRTAPVTKARTTRSRLRKQPTANDGSREVQRFGQRLRARVRAVVHSRLRQVRGTR